MPARKLFPRQHEVLRAVAQNQFTLAYGGVRSGKTDAAAFQMIMWCLQYPGSMFMVGAPYVTTIKTVVKPALETWCEVLGVPYAVSMNPQDFYFRIGESLVKAYPGKSSGRDVPFKGAEFAGAWVDEVTEVDQNFMENLLFRLSAPPHKLLMTTNPAGPAHWLKREWQDERKHPYAQVMLNPTDNPIIMSKPEYVELLRSFTGAKRRRYVSGEWAPEDGLVYNEYDDMFPSIPGWRLADEDPAGECWVGVDFGSSAETAAVYLVPGEFYDVITEEYYVKDPNRRVEDHARSIKGDRAIAEVHADPGGGGAVLRTELRHLGLATYDAAKDLDEGIQVVAKALNTGQLRIHPRCTNLIEELRSYTWDPKFTARGQDRPAQNGKDHALDALRYLCMARYYTQSTSEWQAQIQRSFQRRAA